MKGSDKKTSRILLEAGLITEELLEKAEKEQNETEYRLTQILIGLGVSGEAIRQVLASSLKVPEINLQGREVDPDLLELIPGSWVRKHGIIPLERVESILTLGMVNPFEIDVIKDITFKTALNVRVAIISEAEFPAAIDNYSGASSQGELNLDEFLNNVDAEEIEVLTQGQMPEDSSEVPIIRLVDRIIRDAVEARATDIHVEPTKSHVHVRYRIDGVLGDILDIPKYVQGPMLIRLKIMGSMDIADKRRPQDGRSKIKIGNRILDLRLSSLPTMYGEKIVLRLLEQTKGVTSVADIGFSPNVFHALDGLMEHPQGMMLVTGPTGGGKTTSLYAAITRLNNGKTNIVSVEDPVEYLLPGINQVQINIRAGMTFASGLRSILRQDPDVVFVGEMRDHETAEIAFQAAQTGHLVLSSLHTNDAASAVTRLLAMGVEPYLISSSILGILAQRLVRQLCTQCKVPVSLDENLAQWLSLEAKEKPHQIFASRGCKFCRNTGFWGRFPIAEILVPDETIKDLVLKGRSDRDILSAARQTGMKTIFEDGIDRVLQGLTTLEEVTRVVAPPRLLPEGRRKKPPLVAIEGNKQASSQ